MRFKNSSEKLTESSMQIQQTLGAIINALAYCQYQFDEIFDEVHAPHVEPKSSNEEKRKSDELFRNFIDNQTTRQALSQLLARVSKLKEKIDNPRIEDWNKVELLTSLRPQLLAILADEKYNSLHPEFLNLAQIITYINPQNRWDDDEQAYVSPISFAAIESNQVFYTSGGYILPLQDLLEKPEATIHMLNYHSLCQAERKALANFQFLQFEKNRAFSMKLLNHLYTSRMVKFLAWLAPFTYGVSHCQEDPDYAEKLNFVSRYLHYFNSYFYYNDELRTQECMSAVTLTPSNLFLVLLCVGTSSYCFNLLLKYVNQHHETAVISQGQRVDSLCLQDGLTDFALDKKAEQGTILTIMDKFEDIAAEHQRSNSLTRR